MAIKVSGNTIIPDAVGVLAKANTALGIDSLTAVTTGEKNIVVGYQAGSAVTTGSNNTIIGSLAGSAGLSNTVLIGAGTTERIKVDGTGLYINGAVFTGGGGGTGPKITQVQITDSSYNVLDDTAIDTAGGYIKITGTDFVTGASVIVGSTPASSVSYVSSTVLNCQIPALAAGTYIVYVVNPDGGTAIRVNGLTASGTPQWTTGSTLPDQPVDAAISIQLSASPVSTYSLQAGSNLPPGLSLSSGGLLSGTVTGLTSDTLYSFTIVAIDAEAQDSPRAFTVTLFVSDPYFIYNSLLLRSELSTNSFAIDSSTNKFNISTSTTDVKGSEFNPYLTGWSNYFDGTGDYLTYTASSASLGSSDFTLECYINIQATPSVNAWIYGARSTNISGYLFISSSLIPIFGTDSGTTNLTSSSAISLNTWYHIAVVRSGSTLKMYQNGVEVASQSNSNNYSYTGTVPIGATTPFTTYPFTGYISNLRIVNGTALYTSNFTPPTAPLTAITNTSLLTCATNRFQDLSANGFTITRNGDTAVSSFNPFNLYNTGTDGSVYLDGTGDWLFYTPVVNNNFGTGDFTVEAWVYTTGTGGYLYSSNSNGYVSFSCGTTTLAVQRINVSNDTYSATGIIAGMWNHVAYVRQSGVIKIFLNGTSLTLTGANNTNNYTFNTVAYIGAENAAAPFNGYICNLRVVVGTAVYTTNFTPPTSPLTAIANTRLLTCQYSTGTNNNTFLDNSYYNNIVTRNGNTTTSTFTPFYNNYSVYFDGSGDYLSINYTPGPTISGDFTWETWAYDTGATANGTLLGWRNGGGAGWQGIIIQRNANSNIIASINQTGGLTLTQTSNTYILNQWNHVALVRSGSTVTLYVNGTSAASGTYSGTFTPGTSYWIGSDPFNNIAGVQLQGYISNQRFVLGTAVYTTNFTPPTAPLTAITNTSLLTCQSNRFLDNSTNNFTVTPAGDAKVVKYSPYTLNNFYSPANFGGSTYFDGTGDYLSMTTSPAFTYGTGDFTLEAWVYPTVNAAQAIIGHGDAAGARPYLYINGLTPTIYFNSTGVATGPNVTLNMWNHVACSRSGTTLRVYTNGVAGTSATNSTSLSNTLLIIGAALTGTQPITGYLSNVRIVKGTALYTGNFTPPTTPVITPTEQTSVLLTGSAAGIYDATGINSVETVANAKLSNTVTKYLSSSMYFDGTGDYLGLVGNPELQIGNKNFTIECWVYPTASVTSTILALANVISTGFSAIRARMNTSRQIELYISSDGGTWAASGTTSTALTLNVWSYVTIVRNGSSTGNIQVYINGSSALTLTFAGTAYTAASLKYSIGAVWTASSPAEFWTGYIEDLRITNGIARYTANFTPPTTYDRLR